MSGIQRRYRWVRQSCLSVALWISMSVVATQSANFDRDYLAWKAEQEDQDRRLQHSNQNHRNPAPSAAQQLADPRAATTTTGSPAVQHVAAIQVRLNSANLEQLQQLKGVGVKKAQAILDYRQQHGPFQSIEALKNVKGIGDILFEKNRDQLSL